MITCLRYRSKYGKCKSKGYWSACVSAKFHRSCSVKASLLRSHSEVLIVGNTHLLSSFAPTRCLIAVYSKSACLVWVTLHRLCCRSQIRLRHHICVDVIIRNCTIFIWSRNAINAEAISRIEIAQDFQRRAVSTSSSRPTSSSNTVSSVFSI